MRGIRNPDIGMLILRVIVGVIFAVHGAGKLFGGIEGTAGFFGNVGIPMPGITAWVVGLIEFLGGIALVLGAGSFIAGLLVSAVMVGAILFVHLPNGLTGEGGYEFPLAMLGGALATALVGPGRFSIDGAADSPTRTATATTEPAAEPRTEPGPAAGPTAERPPER